MILSPGVHLVVFYQLFSTPQHLQQKLYGTYNLVNPVPKSPYVDDVLVLTLTCWMWTSVKVCDGHTGAGGVVTRNLLEFEIGIERQKNIQSLGLTDVHRGNGGMVKNIQQVHASP